MKKPSSGTGACARRSPRAEQGVATVWAVVLIALLSLVALVAVGFTGVIGARHRAESAADLAALAGAVAARNGEDACTASAQVAASNDGKLTSCAAEGRVVEVSVAVVTPVIWGSNWQQVGVARAGPDQSPP